MEEKIPVSPESTKSKNMMLWVVLGAILLAGVAFFLLNMNKEKNSISNEIPKVSTSSSETNQTAKNAFSFNTQKKSAHFEDSTPIHEDVYATSPINITLNFNFDLGPGNKISVKSGDEEWTTGEITIINNKLTMQKSLKADMPDGVYSVTYSACWPDGSCHDGNFEFALDSSLKSDYEDMTGKTEVTVDMKNSEFETEKILISKGTKVTWVNMDSDIHYVNTESHPYHTYFPSQNSQGLNNGETYSTTFTVAGQYNYHCSAHYPQMVASLIVQ